MEAAFIGFAEHLQKSQVLQSLSIMQEYGEAPFHF